MSKGNDVNIDQHIADSLKVVNYLREEADFNRSWIDGRRGVGEPRCETKGYIDRRIELAEERDRWADAIEQLVNKSEGIEI